MNLPLSRAKIRTNTWQHPEIPSKSVLTGSGLVVRQEMNKFDLDKVSTMRVVTLITFSGSVLSLALLLLTFYIFVTFR